MASYVWLPEAVQVEEAFGEAFCGRHVGVVAAVGEGVAAAQTKPVTEVLVQLRICGQAGLVPAEGVKGWVQRLKKGQKDSWLKSDTEK